MVILQLLKQFKQEKLKVLVFSEFRTMLNILQYEINQKLSITPLRIDGKISNGQERARICNTFNTSEHFKILLITTRAGGMGLNL